MIAKKLEDIEIADINSLISNSVAEGKSIEYKQELPGGNDASKKEFLADVSSFSNTIGGDLIYGIKEDAGLPVEILGVEIPDVDAEVRRMDGMIQNGLDPRIQYSIRSIPIDNSKYLVIVRVKQSWIKPHRVIFAGHDKFYARGAAGKYSLDVSELREQFTLSETVSRRIKDFRMERTMEIEANNAPITVVGGSKIILHLVPLESFSTTLNIPAEKLFQLYSDLNNLRPMFTDAWFRPQINVAGVIAHTGAGQKEIARSYVQLFRNGAIEAVETSILARSKTERESVIPIYVIEEQIINYTKNYLNALHSLEINPPIFVFITLTDVKGMSFSSTTFKSTSDVHPIREKNLYCPEVTFGTYDEPVHTTLKPALDLVWNACGISGSQNYDDDGNWIQH
ncbi:MAG: ATPase AAA [Parcubacteria group bacterium LiPW_15]|nr:MAG: ATPase AAA [Parcubacteria group bacterium LiPW_15]